MLGESGNPKHLPRIEKYTDHQDSDIRIAAREAASVLTSQ